MTLQIDLARPEDDEGLRRLLATNAVPGRVTVTYEREPNYFLGSGTMGSQCEVVVARYDGEVVGVACRAVRQMFVNGEAIEVGYLGQLRIHEQFRGRWLVSRGFRFLRQLHEQVPVPAYLLSIIEQNREAFGILIERRRDHFPNVQELGRLFTLVLGVSRTKATKRARFHSDQVNNRTGHTHVSSTSGRSDLDLVVEFLRRYGPARQFFPVYTAADFSDNARTRGFRIEDFVVARRQGKIVGVIGLWDQSSYKQTVLRGYAPWLRVARPLYNAGAKVLARPALPQVGEELRYAYASFVCIADDDRDVFRLLVQHTLARASERGHSYLMLGLAEGDPLLPVARAHSHIAYPSRLFLACWENGKEFYERLDRRVPYIEIATL